MNVRTFTAVIHKGMVMVSGNHYHSFMDYGTINSPFGNFPTSYGSNSSVKGTCLGT
jgi:hypothetical protein